MLIHPQFDPVAFSLGPIAVRWYGLMYLVGFALFWWLGRLRSRDAWRGMTRQDVEDLLFYGVLGVIAVLWLFARARGKSFWQVADFSVPLMPLGLAAGRLGNFINGELWGRPADPNVWPWAMIFPQAGDGVPRHPSQLYQVALEGVLLFALLWLYSKKPRPAGHVAAAFLVGYGLLRFIAEFGREPDAFLGLLALQLSMGQWLSVPMVLAGIAFFVYFRSSPAADAAAVRKAGSKR